MAGTVFDFSREYDLPPEIVWDALVDSDLVSGWLATATIDALVGGRYDLRWSGRPNGGETRGVIESFDPPRALSIATSNSGAFEFLLRPLAGGTRGMATELVVRITVDTDPHFSGTTRAYWRSNLDQLGDLLRGHPVDWENWERDRGPVWEDYRRSASTGD